MKYRYILRTWERTYVFIMITPDVVRQFMAQHSSYFTVHSETVVLIGSKAQFYGLSRILVQTKEPWMFVRCKFCQYSNDKFMRLHNVFDGGVLG